MSTTIATIPATPTTTKFAAKASVKSREESLRVDRAPVGCVVRLSALGF